MMGKIKAFFRRLLHRPVKKKEAVHEPIEPVQHKIGSEQQRAPREEILLFDRPLVVRHTEAKNPNDFSLKWRRFEQQVKDARQERIAETNIRRQRSTLGYGLPTRGFKPRSAHEKKLFKLEKKPDEND